MGAPALMDAQASSILRMLNDFASFQRNHAFGGTVSDGGTSQLTGASGVLNLDLDTTAIVEGVVDGTYTGEVAAGVDIDADGGDQVTWTAISDQSVVCAVLLMDDGSLETVAGAVATTGAEAPPTDAEIQTFLDGVPNTLSWLRICNATVNRTGDTAVTLSFDHDVKLVLDWQGSLAVNEAEFRAPAGAGATPTP